MAHSSSTPIGNTAFSWGEGASSTPLGHTAFSWGQPAAASLPNNVSFGAAGASAAAPAGHTAFSWGRATAVTTKTVPSGPCRLLELDENLVTEIIGFLPVSSVLRLASCSKRCLLRPSSLPRLSLALRLADVLLLSLKTLGSIVAIMTGKVSMYRKSYSRVLPPSPSSGLAVASQCRAVDLLVTALPSAQVQRDTV